MIIREFYSVKAVSETELKIINDPEWKKAMLWGEPRKGHPEGKVIFHVKHVLENIAALKNVSNQDKTKLRIIGLTHDAGKYLVDRSIPREGLNHHGVLGRIFASRFTQDSQILKIIELHDDAYAAWKKWKIEKLNEESQHDIDNLILKLDKDLILYALFYICDNRTGTKDSEPLIWFLDKTGLEYLLSENAAELENTLL